jgi:hypothetical protein
MASKGMIEGKWLKENRPPLHFVSDSFVLFSVSRLYLMFDVFRMYFVPDTEKESELEHMRLASQRLLHSYRRRVDELRLLNQVIEEVNRGLTLDEVLNHVWVSFRRVIPFNRIGFSLLNTAGYLEAKWVYCTH